MDMEIDEMDEAPESAGSSRPGEMPDSELHRLTSFSTFAITLDTLLLSEIDN